MNSNSTEINMAELSLSSDSDDSSMNTDAKTYYKATSEFKEDEDQGSISVFEEQPEHQEDNNEAEVQVAPLYTIKQMVNGVSDSGLCHCWSTLNAKTFQVRSKSYLDDYQKVESDKSLFPNRGVDFFMTEQFGPTNIGSRNGILGGELRTKPTFIINFRFPWGVLVFYYEIPSRFLPLLRQKYVTESPTEDFVSFEDFTSQYNTPHDRAMYKFIIGDDAYKNSKLKLIPTITEGNYIVRKLVKGKPVIIGKKLPVTYIYEPANPSEGKAEYFEADLDIGSSSTTAKKIVSVCKKYMTTLTIDMGFVVEGDCESDLPERIMTSTRIHHFDPDLTQTLQC